MLAIIVFASVKVERDIPLSLVITTSPQSNMRHFDEVFAGQEMEDFKRKLLGLYSNSATAFLVDAVTEEDAIHASAGVLFGSKPADKAVPVNTPDPKRGSHWLVSYLGVGPSHPTWFIVEQVSCTANRIRLTYRKAKPIEATRDIRRYCYWIPLGTLKPGVYEVQLYDSSINSVTVMRRVVVLPEKSP